MIEQERYVSRRGWGQRLARGVLAAAGWSVEMSQPRCRKYVLVGAWHTSNWDFILGLLAMFAIGFRFRWMGKDTLFRPPFGGVMRALGGISIDRSTRHNTIEQMAAEFRDRDELVLLITPEGTRSYRDCWKSGFYYIAREAGVPIYLGYVDYANSRLGIGPGFVPGDDVEEDLQRIRDFYADKRGKFPEKHGAIRFKG